MSWSGIPHMPSQNISNVSATDGSNVFVGINYQNEDSEGQDRECLRDLRITDPRDDKARIEATKDDLLKDSYTWILDDPAFCDWWESDSTRLLWIKGDPGKGKTMIMIGLVGEVSKRLESNPESGVLSYFFCQSTEPSLNKAVSVLRGLIYLLAVQQKNLVRHLRERYDAAGNRLFEGPNAFYALRGILLNMLHDPSLARAYLAIDALDECDFQLSDLLDLMTRHDSEPSPKVKWLVASRNRPDIEERLRSDHLRSKISLELNSSYISRAVNAFIDVNVQKLAKLKGYDSGLQEEVKSYLCKKAEGTFLWVALVCKRLGEVRVRRTITILKEFPPRLEPLYERMMEQIQNGEATEIECCMRILCTVTLAYRPISLNELAATADLPEDLSADLESLRELVNLCGSFLTVREETIYFTHQSARDYFCTGKGSKIFTPGQVGEHCKITDLSLRLMSDTLKKDICDLRLPGTLLGDERDSFSLGPLTRIEYACCYWVDHLKLVSRLYQDRTGISDGGQVHTFLLAHFLHWLEALALMGKMSKAVLMVKDLQSIVKSSQSPELYAFVCDANRFVLNHRAITEKAPLQLYSSALLFSPKKSIVRIKFGDQIPKWIKRAPLIQENWSPLLQTLEGHSALISALAFSPNSQLLASASHDFTVRIWDSATGVLYSTLKGDPRSLVIVVAFSPDSRLVASGYCDGTIRLWDLATGSLHSMLQSGSNSTVRTVAFSFDSKLLASGYDDGTIRLWDPATGALHTTLEGHSKVNAVTFSPDGQLLFSVSSTGTVRLRNLATGASHTTLQTNPHGSYIVAFSPDSQLLAFGFRGTELYNPATGALHTNLQNMSDLASSLAFSQDSRLLASVSKSGIRLWDSATGALHSNVGNNSSSGAQVALSPDGQLLASTDFGYVIKLWSLATNISHDIPEVYAPSLDCRFVSAVTFSQDGGLLASASGDAVKIWNTETGDLQRTFRYPNVAFSAVAFSPDSQLLASGSFVGTVKLWNIKATTLGRHYRLHCREFGHLSHSAREVVFSPGSQLLVSVHFNGTVRLWNLATGALHRTFGTGSGLLYRFGGITFSPDSQLLAVAVSGEVKVWDTKTGGIIRTHNTGSQEIRRLYFSDRDLYLDTGSEIFDLRSLDCCRSHAQFPFISPLELRRHWITWRMQNILWLPPDNRPTRVKAVAIHKNIVAIGQESGQVDIIEINPDQIPLDVGT